MTQRRWKKNLGRAQRSTPRGTAAANEHFFFFGYLARSAFFCVIPGRLLRHATVNTLPPLGFAESRRSFVSSAKSAANSHFGGIESRGFQIALHFSRAFFFVASRSRSFRKLRLHTLLSSINLQSTRNFAQNKQRNKIVAKIVALITVSNNKTVTIVTKQKISNKKQKKVCLANFFVFGEFELFEGARAHGTYFHFCECLRWY